MRLSGIKAGDVVEADVRGHRAFCEVVAVGQGELRVKPISPGFTHRVLRARQVLMHWRRSRAGGG